ncbi:MAG: C40 family peptidase, partial [Ignavibacteriaceae bacterium]|nr:C40 family peptidase [Ignavibacteriaceae bacterium]
ININRSAREQYIQGEVITEKSELKFGDLVFFNTRRRVRPGHVGIYIGDNLFAHASTKHGVTVSSLDHNYYSARYMGARRIDNDGVF